MKHTLQKQATKQRADIYFAVYYELGPDRSIEKLYARITALGLRKSVNTLKRWSSEYGWQKRILELEASRSAAKDAAMIKTVEEMNERHAALGKAMTYVGQGGLQPFLEQMKAGRGVRLKPLDSAGLIKTGQYVERLARGQATTRTEIYIEVLNTLVQQFAAVFLDANEILDPEQRKEAFARGCDQALVRFALPEGKGDA